MPGAGQPVSGTGQPRAGRGQGEWASSAEAQETRRLLVQSLQEALGLLALLPLLSAQLKGRSLIAKSPAPGSVGASNPLLAQEHGSARPAPHWESCPQGGFVQAWEQGNLQPPGPARAGPGGWPDVSSGIGLGLTVHSVSQGLH